MRIAVDVMGGDHGCEVVIDGAKQALRAQSGITELYLVGDEPGIRAAMTRKRLDDPRIRVTHAAEVITMEDKPLQAVRHKRDSSLVRAVELVKLNQAEAVISCGNTGALVTAATLGLRRLEGVEHPAIAIVVPTLSGEFILIDAGAKPDATAMHLAQFAVMGHIYSREILGHSRPRVGILSNGSEEFKGVELTQEAFKLCRELDLNFIGYVEGNNIFADTVEVVVTDGFLGNILLKSIEGLGKSVVHLLKSELTANPLRKFGAALAAQAFRNIRQRMDPDAHGGAPILGLNGNVIKAHGSASAEAIKNAIRVAGESIQHRLSQVISEEVIRANARLGLNKPIATSAPALA